MLLGYLMNDLLREYVASGEFTRRGKWLAALREAAMARQRARSTSWQGWRVFLQ